MEKLNNEKIVINNAPVGNYEIRLRMNQIVPSEYSVEYSLVIICPFDHLKFINNPSELKPITPKICSPKYPVHKVFAHCNSETATNCEYEVFEITENKAVKHSLANREFLYAHLDLSKDKNIKKTEIEGFTFSLKLKSDNYVYSNRLIR